VVVIVVAGGVAAALSGRLRASPHARPRPATAPTTAASDPAWSALGPQARCESAVALVTHPDRWPMVCRWRTQSDVLQGQSFPPPKGPPPFDDPHVEMYVDPAQARDQLAHAIAHEFGHMHHTREATFVLQWLAARGLPPDTPTQVWTEDYAEVFAALFSPPSDLWRAPTPRPTPEALAALKADFFSS
jgi:hypothetical protein